MRIHKNKDPKGPTPPVKVGEVVWEKASRDKEKAGGAASPEKERREQTFLEKADAKPEAKAKDAGERHDRC